MRFLLPAFIALMLCGCTAQSADDAAYKRLLTVKEFRQEAGIDESQYQDVDLEKFIEDYEITEENVDSLNLPLLLETYKTTGKTQNVSSIFHEDLPRREDNFTENVTAIAYYENRDTSHLCAYYDLEDNVRYLSSDSYLFSDLSSTQPERFSDDEVIERLDSLGVFSWEAEYGDGNEQSMMLSIQYQNGTVFQVRSDGILSEILPEGYAEMRELLLGL